MKGNVHCRLRIYVTHGEQPQEYDKSTKSKNSNKNRKNENND